MYLWRRDVGGTTKTAFSDLIDMPFMGSDNPTLYSVVKDVKMVGEADMIIGEWMTRMISGPGTLILIPQSRLFGPEYIPKRMMSGVRLMYSVEELRTFIAGNIPQPELLTNEGMWNERDKNDKIPEHLKVRNWRS